MANLFFFFFNRSRLELGIDGNVRLIHRLKRLRDDEKSSTLFHKGDVVVVVVEDEVGAVVGRVEDVRKAQVTKEEVSKATGGGDGEEEDDEMGGIGDVLGEGVGEEAQRRIRGFLAGLFEGGGRGGRNEEEDDDDDGSGSEDGGGGGDDDDGNEEEEEQQVQALIQMGFQEGPSRRAVAASSGDMERAMDWLLQRGEEGNNVNMPTREELRQLRRAAARRAGGGGGAAASGRRRRPPQDVDAPQQQQQQQRQVPQGLRRRQFEPDPQMAARLVEMGFGAQQVGEALREAGNDEERAVAILLGDAGGGGGAGGGGAGGGGGMDEEDAAEEALNNPVLRALLMDPRVQRGLRNPRVLAAFRAIMMDPQQAAQYMNDPQVAPVLLQVNAILQNHNQEEEEE